MGILMGLLIALLMLWGVYKTFPIDKDGNFHGGL